MGLLEGASKLRLIGVVISLIFILIGSAILWNYIDQHTRLEKDQKGARDFYILTTWFVGIFAALSVISAGNARKANAFAMVALSLFVAHFVGFFSLEPATNFAGLNAIRSAVSRLPDNASDDVKEPLQKQLAGGFFAITGMIIATFSMAFRLHMSDSSKIVKLITGAIAIGLSVVGILIYWSREPLNNPSNTQVYSYTAGSLVIIYTLLFTILGTHRSAASFLLFFSGFFSLTSLAFGLTISGTVQDDDDEVHSARAGMLFISAGALLSLFPAYLVYQDEQSANDESSTA